MWKEHYEGDINTWLAADEVGKNAQLKPAVYSTPYKEDLKPGEEYNPDVYTFFRNWITGYIKGYEKKVRNDVLPEILVPSDLELYDLTHQEVRYLGGYYPGFGFADWSESEPNVTEYYFESNNPLYMHKGWFVCTIILHEYLLGHGLVEPLKAIYKTQSPFPLSKLRNDVSFGTHTSGWSCYMEFYGIEAGLYNKIIGYEDDGSAIFSNTGDSNVDTDWVALAISMSDTSRIMSRLKVDTGYHHSSVNPSLHSTANMLHTFQEDTGYYKLGDIIGLGARIYGVPGQSLNYALGTIMMIGLRKEAEARFAAANKPFVIKDFLQNFITGVVQPAPLVALKTKVDNWMATALSM